MRGKGTRDQSYGWGAPAAAPLKNKLIHFPKLSHACPQTRKEKEGRTGMQGGRERV